MTSKVSGLSEKQMTEAVDRNRSRRMPGTRSGHNQWRTRTVYFGEIGFTVAVAVVLMARSSLPSLDLVALFGGGYVAWTMAEYIGHRFVLHNLVPTEHSRHHAAPNDPVIYIFWQIWASFTLIYVIMGDAFLSGVLIAYAWYLFAHHAAHHCPETFPKALAKHHLFHHKLSTANFGVSTTLWDRVFGTMFKGTRS